MTTPKLAVRGITVERARRRILDLPQLDIWPGETLAVVGPNGAGKSTLVLVMALLERPASGDVLIDGERVGRHVLAFRRRMAVVFQEPLLLDTTVAGNVRSGLALRGVPAGEQRRRADDWLSRFGIASLAHRSARTLSGGEAQRASLARALVLEPEVLILDEPFASLDAPTRARLIDDLGNILSATRITTVFVTHDRSEALRLGDRVAVLMAGQIRQIGPPSTVFAAPADEEVASFVGVETIAPGRVRSVADGIAVVDVAGRTIEAIAAGEPGEDVLVCLRPEDIVVAPLADGGQATSARNRLPATVVQITPSGPHTSVMLNAGFPLVALITKQSLEDLSIEPGATVLASFKATAAHLIPHRRQPAAPP